MDDEGRWRAVADVVERRRVALGMRPSQLLKRADVARNTLSRVRGALPVTESTLFAVAGALDFPPSTLVQVSRGALTADQALEQPTETSPGAPPSVEDVNSSQLLVDGRNVTRLTGDEAAALSQVLRTMRSGSHGVDLR